jgi:hypothetical protein
MSNDLSIIESISLADVYGGQETTVGGKVRGRGIEAEGNVTTRGTPERRNDFNTCMNDRQRNCGWLQSPQSCQEMAERGCAGLLGSPRNPQR